MPLGRFPGVGDIILSDLPITMEDLKEVEKKVRSLRLLLFTLVLSGMPAGVPQ